MIREILEFQSIIRFQPKNKLAKEDPNILNQTKKEESGGVMQTPQ